MQAQERRVRAFKRQQREKRARLRTARDRHHPDAHVINKTTRAAAQPPGRTRGARIPLRSP